MDEKLQLNLIYDVDLMIDREGDVRTRTLRNIMCSGTLMMTTRDQ